MQVFVVIVEDDHNGVHGVCCVFSTQEAADKEAARRKEAANNRHRSFYVNEFTLDDPEGA